MICVFSLSVSKQVANDIFLCKYLVDVPYTFPTLKPLGTTGTLLNDHVQCI